MNDKTSYALFRHRCNAIAGCADSIASRARAEGKFELARQCSNVAAYMRSPSHMRPQDAISLLWHYRASLRSGNRKPVGRLVSLNPV